MFWLVQQGPWHRRGNSRIYFVGRLHDSLADAENGGANANADATADANGTANANGNPDGNASGSANANAESIPRVSGWSRASSRAGGKGRATAASDTSWDRLRHESWKEELKANVCHTPAVELARLTDHA